MAVKQGQHSSKGTYCIWCAGCSWLDQLIHTGEDPDTPMRRGDQNLPCRPDLHLCWACGLQLLSEHLERRASRRKKNKEQYSCHRAANSKDRSWGWLLQEQDL